MSDLRASDLVEGQAGKPCRPGDGFTVGYWCHEHQRICGVPPSSPSPKPEMLEKAREWRMCCDKDDCEHGQDDVADLRERLRSSEAEVADALRRVEYWKDGQKIASELLAKVEASVESLRKERDGARKIGRMEAWEKANEQIEAARAEATKAERDARAEREKLESDRDSWKRDCEMYARAWQREIGPLVSKTHLIDALVLTTRKLRADLAALRATPQPPSQEGEPAWKERALHAEMQLTGVQASLESVGRRWKAAEAVIAAMTKKKGTAMPMISFDRLAKSNGVGWSQESIVAALCAEIGHLRLRILDLEAVSHAPVAGFVPSQEGAEKPPTEEPLTCPADGFPLNDHCLYERGFYGTPEPCVNNRMEHHSASYSCRAATPEEIKAAHKCDLIGGDGGLGNCDHFGTLPSPSPEHGGGKA